MWWYQSLSLAFKLSHTLWIRLQLVFVIGPYLPLRQLTTIQRSIILHNKTTAFFFSSCTKRKLFGSSLKRANHIGKEKNSCLQSLIIMRYIILQGLLKLPICKQCLSFDCFHKSYARRGSKRSVSNKFYSICTDPNDSFLWIWLF